MSRTYAITGCASGIGAALAQVLQDQGHRVIAFDLVEPQAHIDRFIPIDLNDPAAIDAATAQLDEPLDGLCNNAGLPPRDGMAAKILQVNFLGQRQFTQATVPHLSEDAAIVNMASRAGHRWHDNLDQIKRLGALHSGEDLTAFLQAEEIEAIRAYDLSKEAMILWTMAMTEPMLQRGIRINSLSPGGVETAILDDFRQAFGDRLTRNEKRAGRVGQPDEIAQIAAFALSPAAAWLKGADIPIDGGMGAFNMADALELGVLGGAYSGR